MKTQLSKPARSHARYTDEYTKEAYRQALAQHGLVPSMSRKANCYDNAFIESFFSSLKYELIYHHRFATRAQARHRHLRLHRDLL